MPRYSTLWDVRVVIRYLKQLGDNSLSLHNLTIKLVTLLTLARPSRSMDLCKLDIGSRTFTVQGVVFKPQHLSTKQSRPSRPLADFFYPRFLENPDVCPVTTLQAYKQRTAEFRALKDGKGKTILFLSWIGNHNPVTSSTIARWIKTCLQEAGIDSGVFRAHSTRGAASSKAAWSGVTVSNILQAADWSSECIIRKHLSEVLPSLI